VSVLKTSAIQSPDSDTPQILLSASGMTFSASALELTGGDLDLPDGTTIDGDTIVVDSALTAGLATKLSPNQITGRNLFHNGSLLVWQRSVGALNVSASTPGYTTADRFWSYQTGTVGVTTTRVTGAPTGFPYAIRWGRPIGNTTTGLTGLGQTLETIDSLRLAGSPVTLSFYAKKGADFTASSSNVAVKLYTGKGTDQSSVNMVAGSWTTSATPIDTTATLTTSWQRFTYTATLPSDITQIGLALSWTPTGTAGADDNVYLTGVQLEAGSVATEFEFKAIGQELANCQRYYETKTSAGFPGGFVSKTSGVGGGGGAIFVSFIVEKRAAPTVNSATVRNANTGATAVVTATSISTYACHYGTGGVSGSIGDAMHLSGTVLIIDADL
jgi:hypothetical protein